MPVFYTRLLERGGKHTISDSSKETRNRGLVVLPAFMIIINNRNNTFSFFYYTRTFLKLLLLHGTFIGR